MHAFYFRNKHCALCHSLQEKNAEDWKLEVVCRFFQPEVIDTFQMVVKFLDNLHNKSSCNIVFVPRNKYFVRSCYKEMSTYIDYCRNDSTNQQQLMCSDHFAPLSTLYSQVPGWFVYRNWFCFECSRLDVPVLGMFCGIKLTEVTSGGFRTLLDFSDILYRKETHRDNQQPCSSQKIRLNRKV